ncbi:hypothetical protein Arub01_17620 [Actinomadura rubrobrunea]|uniref:HNH nuclease domain-containing protein n=1 Tax=Actinomadura rubrobrunea TaxID=115335 RepID=A0A9W6PV57_9ACTN|nr:HNH endonuclease signature motif containing protein [Actinomadura rubrobrunea]GLW63518.1 hypothetical protein Arub01_17620 [Actinomadura rubrobrunea]
MFTLPERFTSKVVIDPETGCHVWTASKTRDGYGKFWFDGRHQYAHRVAYAATHGEIPAGMEVDHMCGRRDCVRPDHLQVVTHVENSRFQVTRDGTHPMANRTHCPRGHALTPENNRPDRAARGWRKCLACNRARTALRNALASALGKSWGIPVREAKKDPRVKAIASEAWNWRPASDAEADEMADVLDAVERIESGRRLTKKQKIAAVYRPPSK